MKKETLAWVVDGMLHENQDRYTLYQMARTLKAGGWPGMADVLEAYCRELEDALGWVQTTR